MLEAMKKMQEDGVAEDPSEIFNKGKAEFDAENWDGAIEDLNKFFKNPKAKERQEGPGRRDLSTVLKVILSSRNIN